MSNINKEIKQYLVQLKFSEHTSDMQNGSGVIITPDEDIAYIFTAKHTFEKDKDETTERGTLFDINYIIKYTKILTVDEEELSIERVIELDNIEVAEDGQKIDLLIFEIEYCDYLSRIPLLPIYNDDFEKCTVSGFPKVNDYKGLAYIPSEFIHSDKNYYFEFDPKKILFNLEDTEVDVIGGISGGGVFVKGNDGQVYLAGIETGLYGVNNLEAVYLIKIIEKINEKVNTRIPTGGFKPLKGFEYQFLSLEFLADNLKNDYIKYMEQQEDILNALDDENNKENKKLKNKFEQTKKNLKDLSVSYLYRGIKFNGYNNYKATANFKKAMFLNKEEVEKYFILAKSKRKPKQKQIDKNIEIDKLKEEIENTNDYELLEDLYIDLIYLLGKTNQYDELLKYRKRLIDLYIENKEFHQAERELKRKPDLDKNFISQKLKDIYLNEEYTKKLNDEEIAKKLFYLLPLIEDESEKDKIRKKIDDLNLYNKNMLALNEKFATMEYQIKDYKSKIELLTNMLSSGTQNQDILNQVIKTDGKLDNVSKEITKKLDEVKTTIIKTNNQKLNIFLENVYRSNQALVSKIQTIYHQNDKVNRKSKMALDNSIKIMNERIEECLNRPISSNGQTSNNIQTDIEKIIKESNWNFYKAIQGLYEKESDSYNRKLLEMSTAFTKREHELHIENLKESYQNELFKVKEKSSRNKWMIIGIIFGIVSYIAYFSLKKLDKKINELNNMEIEQYINNLELKVTDIGKEQNNIIHTQPKANKREIYIIKKGDTLAKIAKKFYNDSNMYKKIAEENNISNIKKIQIGKRLFISI